MLLLSSYYCFKYSLWYETIGNPHSDLCWIEEIKPVQEFLKYFLLITKELSEKSIWFKATTSPFLEKQLRALRLLTVGQNLMDEMFIHTYDYIVLINHFLQMVLLSSCGSVNSTTVLRKHLEQMCTLLRICYILSKPKTVMLISILFTICKNIFYFFWKKKYSIEVNIFCL